MRADGKINTAASHPFSGKPYKNKWQRQRCRNSPLPTVVKTLKKIWRWSHRIGNSPPSFGYNHPDGGEPKSGYKRPTCFSQS
jgi:hypothetical protein